jgi:hypothetical protein
VPAVWGVDDPDAVVLAGEEPVIAGVPAPVAVTLGELAEAGPVEDDPPAGEDDPPLLGSATAVPCPVANAIARLAVTARPLAHAIRCFFDLVLIATPGAATRRETGGPRQTTARATIRAAFLAAYSKQSHDTSTDWPRPKPLRPTSWNTGQYHEEVSQ